MEKRSLVMWTFRRVQKGGLLLLVLPLLLASCSQLVDEEVEQYRSSGVIRGIDRTLCGCCGGYFIEIEGEHLRFTQVPSGSDVEIIDTWDGQQFPIEVELDWHRVQWCDGKIIVVDRMRRKK